MTRILNLTTMAKDPENWGKANLFLFENHFAVAKRNANKKGQNGF